MIFVPQFIKNIICRLFKHSPYSGISTCKVCGHYVKSEIPTRYIPPKRDYPPYTGPLKVIGTTMGWDGITCLEYSGGKVMFGGRPTDYIFHKDYFPEGPYGPIVNPLTGKQMMPAEPRRDTSEVRQAVLTSLVK